VALAAIPLRSAESSVGDQPSAAREGDHRKTSAAPLCCRSHLWRLWIIL